MTSILDNELVKKYFGCCPEFTCAVNHYRKDKPETWIDYRCISERIIRAMQEPIRKGERILLTHDNGKTWEETTMAGQADEPFHPNCLRLPGKFQGPICTHDGCLSCSKCGITWTSGHEVIPRLECQHQLSCASRDRPRNDFCRACGTFPCTITELARQYP